MATGGQQTGRFLAHHLEILFLGQPHIETVESLGNLTPANGVSGIRQGSQDVLGKVLGHEIKGGSEDVITHQDGDLVPPFEVEGFLFTPDGGVIDDVIVHQCGHVDHFEGGPQNQGFLPNLSAITRGEDRKGGPGPFARRPGEIIHHLLNENIISLKGLGDDLLDPIQVFLDGMG